MDFRHVAARLRAPQVPPDGHPRPASAGRAAEVAAIVKALREPGATVVLHGPAGSGTTTLARLARADPRLQRHFRGRVHWVTLGPHARLGALASKINSLVRIADPARADPAADVAEAAGDLAAALTGGPPRLLILDDVRTAEQLAGFPVTGPSARLITTRRADLAGGLVNIGPGNGGPGTNRPGSGAPGSGGPGSGGPGGAVELGRMPDELARAVLTAGRPPLPEEAIAELIALSDGLPRLLRRANRLLADRPDPRAVAVALERDGVVGALADLLAPAERERFAELAVFADDHVPVDLVLGFWRATAGLPRAAGDDLLARLADLRLVARASTGAGDTVRLPVVGPGAPRLHAALLDSVPQPEDSRYLRHHLVEHLLAADRPAPDLRWLAVRLARDGLAGPLADLDLISADLISSGPAGRLRRLLDQAAHLLAPADPPEAVTDILLSRLAEDPEWGPAAAALRPRLVHDGPLPDPLDPALIRTLPSGGWTEALAIAPDGTWLAAGTTAGEVRAWQTADGSLRLRLVHPGPVHALAIAPGGGWLATAGGDHLVRLWDAATGEPRAELDCGTGPLWAVAIAPDGGWLLTGGEDGSVRLWDAATGKHRRNLRGPGAAVRSLAIAPDGRFAAAGDFDGEIRIWDPATGRKTRQFATGRNVSALAISPDGHLVAAAHWSSAIHLCDLRTGDVTRLGGSSQCLAWAPDGSWLAAGEIDDRVRLWDTATAREIRRYPGHRASTDALTWLDGRVDALAIAPDGRWLATGGQDEFVRVWDATAGPRRVPAGGPLRAAALSPDGGTYLTATDQAIRIGPRFLVAPGPVSAAAVADGGDWFVLADDRTVRDSTTGAVLATLTGHQGGTTSILIAPGGDHLATWGPDAPLQMWTRSGGHLEWLRRGVTAAAFTADGDTIAAAEDDGMFVLLDTATGVLRRRLGGVTGEITVLAAAPDGSWVAAAHGPVVDAVSTDGTRTARFRTATGGLIRSVAISPDGRHLAAVDSRRNIQIWDRTAGAVAAMRVDQVAYACTWTSARTLAVSGAAGVYRFRLRGR